MARPRQPGSKLPFSGLGLTKDEDRKLIRILIKEDISFKKLARRLIRKYLAK